MVEDSKVKQTHLCVYFGVKNCARCTSMRLCLLCSRHCDYDYCSHCEDKYKMQICDRCNIRPIFPATSKELCRCCNDVYKRRQNPRNRTWTEPLSELKTVLTKAICEDIANIIMTDIVSCDFCLRFTDKHSVTVYDDCYKLVCQTNCLHKVLSPTCDSCAEEFIAGTHQDIAMNANLSCTMKAIIRSDLAILVGVGKICMDTVTT